MGIYFMEVKFMLGKGDALILLAAFRGILPRSRAETLMSDTAVFVIGLGTFLCW
jgi:hypothetical protein